MHKRKLLIGLATAGAFSAGFGATVFPASAEPRTLAVTLLGGTTIQVTVDVPPGTPLDQIAIPGVTLPIVSISEVGGPPASAPPAAGPGATGSTPPSGATGEAPAADDVPTATQAPQGAEQETTGSTQRRPRAKDDVSVEEGEEQAAQTKALAEKAAADAVKRRTATPDRAADGTPTSVNPTYSFSIPGAAPIGVPNFFIEKFRIPPFLLPIYQAAGIQYGVRWEILAAINEIETDYGRNLNVSSAGALGWMQFIPSTWKAYGTDANDDGKKDPYNPVDAIFAAARYLKAAGAEQDIRKAVFAYNHADWYVDSVLMRARLIGGLPADLVGSLTGLTQGHFPVHAVSRYADDLSESDTKRRIARGKNAAIPVEASATRRGIDIFAKAGSPVIAVQDATVTALGTSRRLGKFVQIRDVYGNTYTYGGLKKLATAFPVPKETESSKAEVAKELDLPKDPKPKAAASAGQQVAKPAKEAADAVLDGAAPDAVDPKLAKERLFANPKNPVAFKNGGEEQVLNADTSSTTFKSYFTEVYGLKREDVTIKPLRKGAKVIAGTILGRIGTTSTTTAPHMTFEVRPAGRGAPRIDPKPILDGWKLLESTAVYRAAGKNPFFGPDAKNPSIGQILLMSKEALQRRVLADSRIEVYEGGRQDIRSGAIDRRVLATLQFLSASGLKPTVSSLASGRRSKLTASGNLSAHPSGSAVDIAKINGIPIIGHQGAGSVTDVTIRRLLTLQGTQKPNQIISLMKFDGTDNTLAMDDHADHIHVGFQPLYSADKRTAQQLDSVLKPSQWIKLIGRLGEIENPTVLTKPSASAIPVTKRASEAHSGE
ncbi:MAG: peptidoglycan DD-metalloendopeptidase family protein [Solirubrobacterales bacterium]|jgi:hypothetical protein|nr:peptidoglycan DD-metalloendopeptidase family protein [Solirubrobacterales bacterium]